MDDILIQAPTKEELHHRIKAVLTRCPEHGIVLSKKKLEINQAVHFAGRIVSHDGVCPDPDRLLPSPSSPPPPTSPVCGHFHHDLSQITVEMRRLLKKGTAWLWTPEHNQELQRLKQRLLEPPVVRYFDATLPSSILTDASRRGISFALIQTAPTALLVSLLAAPGPSTRQRPGMPR